MTDTQSHARTHSQQSQGAGKELVKKLGNCKDSKVHLIFCPDCFVRQKSEGTGGRAVGQLDGQESFYKISFLPTLPRTTHVRAYSSLRQGSPFVKENWSSWPATIERTETHARCIEARQGGGEEEEGGVKILKLLGVNIWLVTIVSFPPHSLHTQRNTS